MLNRISVPALASFALLLVACPRAKTEPPEAGPAVVTMDTADSGAAVVNTATTTAPTLATAAKPAAAKPADAGGATAADAGGAAAADAGPAPQLCCCNVGKGYSHISQSNCTTTMKGQCVAKEECTKRECCCEVGGKKSTQMSSECTKTMKGKCVGKEQCG